MFLPGLNTHRYEKNKFYKYKIKLKYLTDELEAYLNTGTDNTTDCLEHHTISQGSKISTLLERVLSRALITNDVCRYQTN